MSDIAFTSYKKWILIAIGIGIIALYFGMNSGGTNTVLWQKREPMPYAVVSAHELATQAGIEVLQKGGTAADAAVAVAAMLSVVEPWFSSTLGGGTWALYYDASRNEITSLDGVGPTGSKATATDYARRAGTPGMHQANVPGAWDGWMVWLERYGRLDLADILNPAIQTAQSGYVINADMADWLGRDLSNIRNRPETALLYMRQGNVLQEGDIVYQQDMARTFEALVSAYAQARDDGRTQAIQAARDYYYRGPIAQAIVDFSDQHGGYVTLDDFANFEASIVDAISIKYNDEIEVFQSPPNSQGITMLMALNILKDFDFENLTPDHPDTVHIIAEAVKLAFADRYYHVGDPDRVAVPVDTLLSEQNATGQRNRIDMDRAMQWPISDELMNNISVDKDAVHTTTFQIRDQYGNAASVTTSLGAQFYVVGETGIHINHRMRFLALDEGNPNQVAPSYKVRHTSNPYIALKNNKPYILGGNTGADTQSQGQAVQFINLVEFGLGAQEVVDRPRFVSTAFPSTVYSYQVRNTLQMEEGFPQATIAALRAKGHTVDTTTGTFGNANVIVIGEDDSTLDIGVETRNGASSKIVEQPL